MSIENTTMHVLDLDAREVSEQMNKWALVSWFNRTTTLACTAVILITFKMVLTYVVGGHIYMLGTTAISLSQLVMYNKEITGVAIRVPWYWRMSVYIKIVSRASLFICTRKWLTHEMYKVVNRQIEKEIAKYNKQPKTLDRMMDRWKRYNIDEYWQKLGLVKNKLVEQAVNVRMRAKEPINPSQTNPQVMDMRDIIAKPIIPFEYARNWATSDMTDEMHVKSLFKRVVGVRNEYSTREQLNLCEIMCKDTELLPKCQVTAKQAVHKALSSKGTAGQFAKQSKMESFWKDSVSPETSEFWLQTTAKAYQNTLCTDYIPQEFVQYMLYRKKEPLEIDENGEIKVTRIMNAPNLAARVTDCKPFMPFNDAMVEGRKKLYAQVGCNILRELKTLITHDERALAVLMDYKDFDGSQSAVQMIACCKARVKYMQENSQPIEDVAYMLPRYKRHYRRNVKSTFGVEYDTVGQLGSGDLTTTDDNTLKSHAQNKRTDKMIVSEYSKKKTEKDAPPEEIIMGGACLGDDTLKKIHKDVPKYVNVEQQIKQTTEEIGWTIKPGSFELKDMLQDGSVFMLSHSVKRRKFATSNMAVTLEFAAIIKERCRMFGKWCIASEMEPFMSTDNAAKLTSKYMTSIMVGIGNPEVIMPSVYMLLYCRSTMTNYNESYLTQANLPSNMKSLLLNRAVYLQTGIRCSSTMLVNIELRDDEEKLVRRGIEEVNQLIAHYINIGYLHDDKQTYYKIDIVGKWWNYDGVIRHTNELLNSLERRGKIRTKKNENHNKWWISRYELAKDDIEIDKHSVKTCGHIVPKGVSHDGQFNVVIKCKHCYADDDEDMTGDINVGLSTTDDHSIEL